MIKLVVSPRGETRLETIGFAGPECREASDFLEAALGSRKSERMTSEFFIQRSEEQTEREST